jgi:hypothetical protein
MNTLSDKMTPDAHSRPGYLKCPLCQRPFAAHTVMSEDVSTIGAAGSRPIGWRCPGA